MAIAEAATRTVAEEAVDMAVTAEAVDTTTAVAVVVDMKTAEPGLATIAVVAEATIGVAMIGTPAYT
eukprot:COSAG02_NODE_4361_length_5453_cov_2.128689_6_plen_67_part_00